MNASTEDVFAAANGGGAILTKDEFDAWLAQHDAEVAAKALRQAADDAEQYARDTYWRDDSMFHHNSRVAAQGHAERLRERADRIETEGSKG